MISWCYGFSERFRSVQKLLDLLAFWVLLGFLLVIASGCVSSGKNLSEELVGKQLVEGSGWSNVRAPVEVRWRVSEFASHFWIIDQLSRWDERVISPEYRRYFEIKGEINAKDLAMLETYAEVRRAHSGAVFANRVELQGGRQNVFLDLLSPLRSYEDFSRSFLQADDVEHAIVALALRKKEVEVIRMVFEHFRPRIERLLTASRYLKYSAKRLELLSYRGDLGGYLARMASFFRVDTALERAIVVEIVWAPDGFAQATQFGEHVVIPLPLTGVVEERDLAGWLGVIVHEIGHYYVSSMNSQRRQSASDRILSEVGVVNVRRANVVDEALATAIGNIVYMKRAFPEYFEDQVFYSFDPDYEYPYAIDSLARALAAPLEASLGQTNGAFDEGFLDRLVEIHRQVFRPMPRHHTRIALVFAENSQMARYFVGLFPGIRQLHRVGNEAAFVADSARQQESTRWVLMTAAHVLEDPERAQILSIPLIDRLARRVQAGDETSCFQAYQRREHGPFDFIAVGRTPDDLRQILIYVHTYIGIPAEGAICLGDNR